jgi:8-oxo-dGTP pyrophosphatase MutT (NUDIX family)
MSEKKSEKNAQGNKKESERKNDDEKLIPILDMGKQLLPELPDKKNNQKIIKSNKYIYEPFFLNYKNELFYKKNLFCINCGISGHTFSNCREPIKSFGIILFKIDGIKLIPKIYNTLVNKQDTFHESVSRLHISPVLTSLADGSHSKIDHNLKRKKNIMNSVTCPVLDRDNDLKIYSIFRSCIKFLMIKRRYSLGFVEIVRGHYDITDEQLLIHIFKQMTPEEIKLIKTKDFEKMWTIVWGNSLEVAKDKIKNLSQEYYEAKNKFIELTSNHLTLFESLLKVKLQWNIPEWGFPKGRRSHDNTTESDIECAKREFTEETNFKENEFTLLPNIKRVEENLIGTNGLLYRHIYYIGIPLVEKKLYVDEKIETQLTEVGDIKWVDIDEALILIRSYHQDKIKIIVSLFNYLMEKIIRYYANKRRKRSKTDITMNGEGNSNK